MGSLPEVSNLTIASVSGCCAGLLLALSLLLLYYCFRRRRLYKSLRQSAGDPAAQLCHSKSSPRIPCSVDKPDSLLLEQQKQQYQQQQPLYRPWDDASPSLNGFSTTGIDDFLCDSSAPSAETSAVFATLRSGYFPLGGGQEEALPRPQQQTKRIVYEVVV